MAEQPLSDKAASGVAASSKPGETLRLEEVVRQHYEELYRYAYRLSGTAADAEDLTQQTFLVASEKLSQVRDAAGVRGWLFAILRNAYRQALRRPTPLIAANLSDELPEPADPHSQAETTEEIDSEALQLALNELPDEFKLVLLAFYFEELSYREIAEQLQLPLGTVMSRLARGKAHLRTVLSNHDRSTRAEPVSKRSHLPIKPAH